MRAEIERIGELVTAITTVIMANVIMKKEPANNANSAMRKLQFVHLTADAIDKNACSRTQRQTFLLKTI